MSPPLDVEPAGHESSLDSSDTPHLKVAEAPPQQLKSLPISRDQNNNQDDEDDDDNATLKKLRRELKHTRSDLEQLRHEYDDLRRDHVRLLSSRESSPSKTSLKCAAFMLPRYSGGDPRDYASTWLRRVADAALTFGWSDEETLKAAREALDGPARNWLYSHRRDVADWKRFRDAFLEEYHPERTSLAKKFLRLARRKMRAGEEEPLEYAMEVKRMGEELELRGEDIAEYIVLGLDEETRVKARLGGRRASGKVLHRSQQMLQLEEVIRRLRGLGEASKVEIKIAEKEEEQCGRCNELGHDCEECEELVQHGVVRFLVWLMVLMCFFGAFLVASVQMGVMDWCEESIFVDWWESIYSLTF